VGIETPYDGNVAQDSLEKIIELEDEAVATSGNYRRFYLAEDGSKIAHTIDPTTGRSVSSDLLSVTIVAPTCAEADAAATMFMAMGSGDETLALADECAREYGWRYYFIYADGEDYRIECSEELE
jgi:thiamine biosynthesis lipoprotein